MTDLQEQTSRKSHTVPRMIRVMLVDDHNLVREGLHLLLRHAPDIVIVGEASDGIAALALVGHLKPDVVVLDIEMPRGDGEAALRELKQRWPDVRVLMLTMHSESDWLLPMLAAGANGFGLGSGVYKPGQDAATVGRQAAAYVAAVRGARA